MRKIIYPLIALICVAIYVWYEAQQKIAQNPLSTETAQTEKDSKTSSSKKVENWITTADYLPISNGEVINHYTYSLSYNENHEQANWTAHVLKARDINSEEYQRPYFEIDPDVSTGAAHWKNYKKSGYDKGHLVPAGDRKANLESYTETFLTSNISPQKHSFNAGIWNDLEKNIRKYALEYGDVYVVTGPVLKEGLKTIGTENVSVPEAFFKIIYSKDVDGGKMFAYLIPTDAKTRSFNTYIVSVDRVEELTGIDFFPQLVDEVEVRLESTIGSGL